MGRPLIARLPNRWRLTGWVLAAVLLVTVVTGTVAVRVVEGKFRESIDEDLRVQARGLVVAAEVIGLPELRELTERVGIADHEHAFLILGADGVEAFMASGPLDAPHSPPAVEAIGIDRLRARSGEPFDLTSVDGRMDYRVLVSQIDDGHLAVAAMPLGGLDHALATLIRVLLVAAVIASAVLAVTVALVSAHVTRPLDAMIGTAEAIGAGDLQARAPTDGVEDVARLAGALNAMLDRLERAFADRQASEEALRRFVADASHELRTPLATILGYAELHRSFPAPEQVDQAMESIAAAAERMRMLVDELLILARLDERRPAEPAPVDLAGLVRGAVADARAIDPDRPLTLDVDGAAAPAVVDGDALALRQAVDNLLANTRAHTPPGTPVTVAVTGDGHRLVVTVADEGPGLDADDAAHVFERFYRAERSRARPGGAGLGLSIVAAIAHAHDGTVTVDTAPGQGATFRLDLPARP